MQNVWLRQSDSSPQKGQGLNFERSLTGPLHTLSSLIQSQRQVILDNGKISNHKIQNQNQVLQIQNHCHNQSQDHTQNQNRTRNNDAKTECISKFRINVITKVRIIIKVRVTPEKMMPRQNTSSLLESDWCQWTASSRGLSHRRLPSSSAFSHCHWSPAQSLRTSVSKPNQIVIQSWSILKSVVICLYLRPGTTCSVQRLHCTSQHNLTTCWLSSPHFPAVLRHVSPSNNKVDIGWRISTTNWQNKCWQEIQSHGMRV
jgi:hypothetical protein